MSLKILISRNIRIFRRQAGISQEVLAQKCGMTLRYISYLENSAQNVTIDTLVRLANALNCQVKDFLLEPEEKRSKTKGNGPSGRSKKEKHLVEFVESLDHVIEVLT